MGYWNPYLNNSFFLLMRREVVKQEGQERIVTSVQPGLKHYKTFTILMQQFIGLRVLNGVETMSASISNSRWNDLMKEQTPPVVSNNRNLFARFGVQPQERHCPSCDSIVYTRRHRLCGACGGVLPKDCLFTDSEAESVAMLMTTERQRHRAWLKKMELI